MIFPVAALILSNQIFLQRKNAYRKNLLEQKKYSAKVAVKISGEVFKNTAETYTFWDEFVFLGIQKKNKEWNDANLLPIISLQGSDHIWTADQNFNITYHCFDSTRFDMPLPISKNQIFTFIDSTENSSKRYLEFFTRYQDKIIQFFCITVHRSDDSKRKRKPDGFFINTNVLDSTYFAKIKTISDISVEQVFDTLSQESEQLIIYEALKDFAGRNIAYLKFTTNNNFDEKEKELNFISTIIFIFLILLIIFISIFFIHKEISLPLSNLLRTLDTRNLKFIENLKSKTREFKLLSLLIEKFFAQKTELQRMSYELIEKNEEINQQKEEIQTIAESLQSTNEEISAINEQLNAVNKEILSKNTKISQSIQYAFRIQNAVFPNPKFLTSIFPENFIFFKPKEAVSGDFYYFKQISDYFLVAVADCTGHGIPGAFMSILTTALLHEIVAKREITESGQVLNELRKLLREALAKTDTESKEYVEIAFCSINLKTKELQFAGSYLPFYFVRNQEISVMKPDRMPVAAYVSDKFFTNHKIALQKNDVFYLCTDGFFTQFGGEKDEKFGSKRLTEMLQNISNQDFDEQKNSLENIFCQWKGKNLQVDDVLIVGIKI